MFSRKIILKAVSKIMNIQSKTNRDENSRLALSILPCPCLLPINAPPPVASMMEIPKNIQVSGMTIFMAANPLESTYFEIKNPSMVV